MHLAWQGGGFRLEIETVFEIRKSRMKFWDYGSSRNRIFSKQLKIAKYLDKPAK